MLASCPSGQVCSTKAKRRMEDARQQVGVQMIEDLNTLGDG